MATSTATTIFPIDSHILQSGVVFYYWNGDLNFDGLIGGDDYFLVDSEILYAGGAGTIL